MIQPKTMQIIAEISCGWFAVGYSAHEVMAYVSGQDLAGAICDLGNSGTAQVVVTPDEVESLFRRIISRTGLDRRQHQQSCAPYYRKGPAGKASIVSRNQRSGLDQRGELK